MERARMENIHHELHGSDSHAIKCTVSQLCALCKDYRKFEPAMASAKALIRRGEKKLKQAEEKRRLFRANLNHRRDRLASRLPAEIVARIFKATLTRKLMPGLQDHVIDSPLFLGAVCQTWRKIAWSTPDLWDWIHIFLRRTANEYLEETVEGWIERSGTLPLTIQMTCAEGWTDPESIVCSDFDFIIPINACSTRWENVSFTGPSTITQFLSGSKDGTASLQVLRINTTDGTHDYFAFEMPSRPHSLAMGKMPEAWDEMNIVWDALVEIHLENLTAGLCIQAIQQMPRLTKCVLACDGIENWDLSDTPAGRFIHSNLTRFLYTTKTTRRRSRSLLDHFSFPNLTDLRIICDDDAEAIMLNIFNGGPLESHFLWEHSIKQFLIDSSPKLSSLELRLPKFQLHWLVEMLGTKEQLTTLVLKDSSLISSSDFYSFLVHLANTPPNSPDRHDSSPDFLPSLQSLSISGCINSTPEKSVFEAILDACGRPSDLRNPCRRPLTEMVVRLHNFPETLHDTVNMHILL